MQKWAKQTGFTIVELLIVIVVIAILAAITIVAYNGIRERSIASAVQSAMSQQLKSLQSFRTLNAELYPATLTDARGANILVDDSNITYTDYFVTTDRRNFCATGTRNAIRYSISSTHGAPLPGKCVENLITNPSFETNLTGWNAGGATPTVTRTTGGRSGTFLVQLTKASPVSDAQFNATGPLASDTNYSVAYWAWGNDATCYVGNQFGRNNSYLPFITNGETLTATPTIYRGNAISPPSSTQFRWRIVPCLNGTSTVYYDGFTAVQADFPLKTTYDGDSLGWFWTGTPHNSTSIGPAEAL